MSRRRRKPQLRRPSLSRTKGFSTCGVVGRQGQENQLPHFSFNADKGFSSVAGSPTLSDCIEESPTTERRQQGGGFQPAALPLRNRTNLPALGAAAMRAGSPGFGHARRQSNPFKPNRKTFRRTLSMFEAPEEVMKNKKELVPPPAVTLGSALVEEQVPCLPHFLPEDQHDGIPRITQADFVRLLDGEFSDRYDNKIVIDCRFEYEYEGGHVKSAVNYNDKELLSNHLFTNPMVGRTVLIFHCEYSVHRAPLMARHVRSTDRTHNLANYPHLTYPDVYILQGGYSLFFNENRQRCDPQAHVKMDDEQHVSTCEREMGKLRNNGRDGRARRGLNRAQTFAFGQSQQQRDTAANESPTVFQASRPRLPANRMFGRVGTTMACGPSHVEEDEDDGFSSPIPSIGRAPPRRFASY